MAGIEYFLKKIIEKSNKATTKVICLTLKLQVKLESVYLSGRAETKKINRDIEEIISLVEERDGMEKIYNGMEISRLKYDLSVCQILN